MRADGVWRSLVARLLWEQEVGGSNPLTPTRFLWKNRPGGSVASRIPCRLLLRPDERNRRCQGPILLHGLDTRASGSKIGAENAGIAQLVEHNLAKVGVASSSLVSRSRSHEPRPAGVFCGWCIAPRAGTLVADTEGQMAEWLCSGLQSRVRRFDSDSGLHIFRRCARPGPGGEIGRRSGLKIRRPQGHAGSSPAPGTNIMFFVAFRNVEGELRSGVGSPADFDSGETGRHFRGSRLPVPDSLLRYPGNGQKPEPTAWDLNTGNPCTWIQKS